MTDPLDSLILAAKAQAWDEGFDAGERDVWNHREHPDGFDSGCIKNPYRTQSSATEQADSPAQPETPKVAPDERADTAAAAVGSDDSTATTRQGETPATPRPAVLGRNIGSHCRCGRPDLPADHVRTLLCDPQPADGVKIYLRTLGEITTDERVLAAVAGLRGELLDENTRRSVAHVLRKVAGRKHRRPRTAKALNTLADTLELSFSAEVVA